MDIKEKFEDFIAQYPIFEYRLLDTADIKVQERVRTICKQECERYGSTWACPPAVGELPECEKKIHSFPQAIFFQCGGSIGHDEHGRDAFHTNGTRRSYRKSPGFSGGRRI